MYTCSDELCVSVCGRNFADEFDPERRCGIVEEGTAGAVLIGRVEAIVYAGPLSIMVFYAISNLPRMYGHQRKDKACR